MAKTVIEMTPEKLEKLSKNLREKKNKPAMVEKEIKPLTILCGTLRDSFCDYQFQINKGTGSGFKHKVSTNTGVVTDDMYKVFKVFNRHFACIDDVFKHSGYEVENIDLEENNPLVDLYKVDGFKISGSDDNESIVLSGSKYLSCGGRSTWDSPRIELGKLSSYKWYNELKIASDNARLEVELYHAGKIVVQEEKKKNPKQLNIADEMESNNTIDFESNKL